MTRYLRFDQDSGELVPLSLFVRAMGLISSGESITDVIDRAIDSLPKDTQGAVLEGGVSDGRVVVAVALKLKDDWTVTLAGERSKEGAYAGRFEVKHSW